MAGTEPLFELRSWGGACQPMDLLDAMAPTDASFTLSGDPSTWVESHGPNAGMPLGTSGDFVVYIAPPPGSAETGEKIRCSGIVGPLVSVAQTGSGPTLWTGRGFDGTTAQAHTPPTNPSGLTTVTWTSEDFYEFNLLVMQLLGSLGASGTVVKSNGTGLVFGGFSFLEPTSKNADYSAVANDFVQMSGAHTVALPLPTEGTMVGVQSVAGSGSAPCTVSSVTNGGYIIGPGVAATAQTALLGARGAFMVLVADGTNWNIVAGQQDSGWINVGSGGSTFAGTSNSGSPTAQFRIQGNVVRLAGVVNNTNQGPGYSTAFTLPAGYRPTAHRTFSTWQIGGSKSDATTVDTTGVVTSPDGGGTVTTALDQIVYTTD